MNRRKFLKRAAALTAGVAVAGPLATKSMAATQKPAGLVPVGCVVAFLKSFTGTPALPDEFVECNGQTLSDAQSLYNTKVIPNLNGVSGTKRFLRGSSTSGTTGGTETHCHSISYCPYSACGMSQLNPICIHTALAGTLPSYYEVVWVMRIK